MRFMLTATWKQPLDETMMALLPAEEARADELAKQGILEALYLPADQSGAWTVWQCKSLDEVQELAQTLPLYKYLNFDIALLED
ncbi:MAG TPA: muconolactone Delta-isomerase family protein [Caldilineaceae bacterium]|nr:muconolactone Delta-isomerase family protein [Caldilineaceae bacterium]